MAVSGPLSIFDCAMIVHDKCVVHTSCFVTPPIAFSYVWS